MTDNGRILLGHGAGGRLSHELVRDRFLPALGNPVLSKLSDAAILSELPPGKPALTTDGFVVDPLVFAGGDLGYLSVCGTVNDLAVAGAKPLWLTWALILEEGLESSLLETIVEGAARAAREAEVTLVAGDTKVVPKGKGDRAYAVTTGLGVVPPERDWGDHRVAVGDVVMITGSLGDHGATIMANRHNIDAGALESDCAPLVSLIEALAASGADVHAVHDPTRGGVATVCHEVSTRAGVCTVLEEEHLPIRGETLAACELLGLDPLYLACEGRAVIWTDERSAQSALDTLHGHPLGRDAVAIGRVTESGIVPLILRTSIGGDRPLDMLSGIDLPRIC